MTSNGFYGYSYVCTCGEMISTDGGLDYADQLLFITTLVDRHRKAHRDRTLGALDERD